ncbi:hypothetical protein BDV12DRAFT_211281 [Aspergillus spectabilis]
MSWSRTCLLILFDLRNQLRTRYPGSGAMADLEESIQLKREAVTATPHDHPDRARYLNNLGAALWGRYSRTGVLANLEESIKIGREAVTATSEDHPDRALYLNNLGVWLKDRVSIQIGREVVTATPEDHPHRARDRYTRTGAIADLEESIQIGRETVTATPEDHPDQAINRYSRTGAMADLEESIQIGREAVTATPEDHPNRAGYLINLGIALGDRYSRIGAIADLEESIQVGREAVTATREDHPDRALYLNNLGRALRDRYSRIGVMADFVESIKIVQEAVAATPEDHPSRALYLHNLGTALGDRYSRTGALPDLKESIQIGREAVTSASEDHPDRALYLHNLGSALQARYSKTRETADLEEAISYQESALRQETALTTTRIKAARDAIRTYETADTAVHLIPRLTLRSLENSDKQHLLGEAVGFASHAAAAALNAQKGAMVALNLLELGRGVLAASVEEVRVDIQDLHDKHPMMAKNFMQLRAILDKPIPRNIPADIYRESSWQAQARQRAKAGKELDKLIINIRKQPGFDDFLQAPSEKEMRHAAQRGPIVTINISQYRCDAILVRQDKIRVLPLPNLSSGDIEEKAKSNDLGNPRVLEWLWDSIVDPILQALGFTQSPSDCNWPHIWWIPTGPLTKFPLHAAGYHNQGRSKTVLDRVMSSYSSSVKAIIHGRRRPTEQSSSAHALLVAMEHTPGSNHLPFAAKEVKILRDMCKSMGLHSIQPKCYKRDIISYLPECRIFHFAGHGYTDHADPSKSELILEDGKDNSLTVASLLEMNLREHTPFLAYLSACGTGQIKDERFIDESIHLITAFQLAGFRHVIGTLWNVNDEICVDMASITYKGMADGQMCDEAVYHWLHASPESGRQSKPARDTLPRDIIPTDTETGGGEGSTQALWVPYVHIGV